MCSFTLIFVRIAISTARQNLGRATVSSMYMRNSQEFWANLAYGALLGFASNAQVSASMWCRRRVGFKWRQRLIELAHEKYFDKLCFYRQHDLPCPISDVGQRVVLDIARTCNSLTQLVQMGLSVSISTAYVSGLYGWSLIITYTKFVVS